MRLGALVAREPASRYTPIGVHGQPVSDAHVTLRAALLQRFGPAHAACFARPDRDPRDETIGWIADVPGEARRWTDLPPDEQVLRSLDLEGYRADLLSYARALREGAAGAPGGDGAARSIAALLEQAIIVPDESHVHFIGEQPVLSFWGFRQTDGSSVVGLGLAPPAAVPAAAAPAAAVAAPVIAAAPWWRRLLWLLPLLLLLALLLLWLLWGQGCAVLDPVLPVPPAADRAETPVPVEPGVPVLPGAPGGSSFGVVPGVPGGDQSVPPGSETSPAEPPSAEPPSGAPPATEPPAPEPPQTEPPPAEPPPAEPPPVEPPPVEPPPTEPPPTEPPPTEPPPAEPPPAEPPPAEPPPAGPPLEIPPEAARSGDVGFLDGQWRSQRGLVDNVTGEALEQRYQFGSDGSGEAIVRRSDGVECRGPVRGRLVDGQLVLEEEGKLTCPDGRTYDPSVTRCERTASGLTVCRGANPDGTGYRVGLERVP